MGLVSKYYVSKNASARTGLHTVHKTGCRYLPAYPSTVDLGRHLSFDDAMKAAKDKFPAVTKCKHCSGEGSYDKYSSRKSAFY